MSDDAAVRPYAVSYHRNGSSGEGCHAVLFKSDSHSLPGIVFDTPEHVAILDLARLAAGDVEMCSNSWRHEAFERGLRTAVADYEGRRAALPPPEDPEAAPSVHAGPRPIPGGRKNPRRKAAGV